MFKFTLNRNALQSLGLSLFWAVLTAVIGMLSNGNPVTWLALFGGAYSVLHSWFTTNEARLVASVTTDQFTAKVLTEAFNVATAGSVPLVTTATTTTAATTTAIVAPPLPPPSPATTATALGPTVANPVDNEVKS